MNAVFADAFYWIALFNPADAYHDAAIPTTQGLKSRLLTTYWVLVEVADALSAPVYRTGMAHLFRDLAVDVNVEIVHASAAWFDSGLELHMQRSDKSWSLTDCISFAVMSDRGMTEALTADRHFEQAGLRALFRPV